MNKNSYKEKLLFNFAKINYLLEKKSNLLVFLLILIGVLIPTLSGSMTTNFWYRLFSILNSPFYNFMLFIATGLNVIHISGELSKSYNIVNRYANYKILIKKFIHDIVVTTIILSIVGFILSISGAVIFSFGNISMIEHNIYGIPIIIYIVFYIIRGCIFACIVNSIIYLLSLLINKIGAIIIVLLLNSPFMIISKIFIIEHFYNMPLLYHYYYLSIEYSTFLLEIICSVLELFLLIIIRSLIHHFVTLKKRDLN